MVIDIVDGVRISNEGPQNVTLEKRRIVQEGPNKGTVSWDVVGYYGSLREAARALLGRHFQLLGGATGADAAKDLRALIDAIDYGADLIARACEEKKEPVPA